MNPYIDLPVQEEDEFYTNPSYLSFSGRYDTTLPSPILQQGHTYGNIFQPSNDSISEGFADDHSFIENYLFATTPLALNFEHLSPHPNAEKPRKLVTKTLKMEKLASCRKFSGYPRDNGDKFLKEFESFAKLHELDDDDGDDSRKLAAFHLHLQGPALTWYNGLAPGLDWDTIKQGFLDKYVTIGWQHPSVVIESESFQNMVLGQTQEIEDFYCQLMEKGKILSKPEEEIMFKFINGLPDKLAFYVRTSKPGNISEALSYAKTGEAYKYRVHEINHTVAAAKVTDSTSEVAELKLQVSELANMFNNLSATGNIGSKQGQVTNSQMPSKGRLCYNCNSPDHARKFCNWNGTGSISPETTCQLCQQEGHTARQCSKFYVNRQNTNNIPTCQICFKKGHNATQCYQLQANSGQENWRALGDDRHGRPGKR